MELIEIHLSLTYVILNAFAVRKLQYLTGC